MRKFFLLMSLILAVLGVRNAAHAQGLKKNSAPLKHKSPVDFVPKGYVIVDTISGDLNRDGSDDSILIIKGTDKKNVVIDELLGELDRNRRGIIILLKKNSDFEMALKNVDCFSSENEDGGVYFAPELSINIRKGNLYIGYLHGRYGSWTYTFRYQNSDFDLIGYDRSSNSGPRVNEEVSINFLTKRKLLKRNISEQTDVENMVFKKTWKKIKLKKLVKLSDIEDLSEIDMSEY